MINIDKADIKDKIYKKLLPSGWGYKLRSFFLSDEFDTVLDKLVDNAEKGKRFTPPLKYVFRGFEECNYKDLRVVFIGQDVYPFLGIADGIAFSCSLTGKEQPSLTKIFNCIEEAYELEDYNRDPDLSRWSNQGILLINTALTCQIDNVGTHYDIWKPFISRVIDTINTDTQGTIFVMIGREAQGFSSLIDSKRHYIIEVEHPAYASRQKRLWNAGRMFKEIDQILLKNNNEKIIW